MAKLTFTRENGWPIMGPLGKKEARLLQSNLTSGEVVIGLVIANFGQAVVATNHKVIIVKTGLMAGQAFGGKATSFDYHNIGAVAIRTGFAQGELEIINPSMPTVQGHRNRDKVKISEALNGVVFGTTEAPLFEEFAAKVREMVSDTYSAANENDAPRDGTASIPEQIKELGELHAAGILTDEEFSAKKAELLKRM